VTANLRPGRDVVTDEGPADPFDAASPAGALGHRMALDATRKLPDE
jgi:4-hydroxy-3-polyprenylbenzoate decarboxylase